MQLYKELKIFEIMFLLAKNFVSLVINPHSYLRDIFSVEIKKLNKKIEQIRQISQ